MSTGFSDLLRGSGRFAKRCSRSASINSIWSMKLKTLLARVYSKYGSRRANSRLVFWKVLGGRLTKLHEIHNFYVYIQPFGL